MTLIGTQANLKHTHISIVVSYELNIELFGMRGVIKSIRLLFKRLYDCFQIYIYLLITWLVKLDFQPGKFILNQI